MIRNKYLTLLVAIVLLFFAVRERDQDVKSGKVEGKTFKETLAQNYENIKGFISEYREAAIEKSDEDNWVSELGLKVTPLTANQSPGIISEKLADMVQTFFVTKKGKEIFERLLVTPPGADGNVDILGLTRAPSILYFNISRNDQKIGEGAPLECGQRASFKYTALLQGKKEIHSSATDKVETTRIGDLKYLPGIEYYLIGMKSGGVRDVIIPPSQAYGLGSKYFDDKLASKFIFLHLEVQKNLSQAPNYTDFRIVTEKTSGIDLVMCGDKVAITYQIFSENKKALSNKLTKTITLGGVDLPYGIIKAVEGISKGETREVTIPPHLRKTIDGRNTNFFEKSVDQQKNIIMKIYTVKKISLYE